MKHLNEACARCDEFFPDTNEKRFLELREARDPGVLVY